MLTIERIVCIVNVLSEVSIPKFGEGKMEGTKPEEKQKNQQNFDSIEGRD